MSTNEVEEDAEAAADEGHKQSSSSGSTDKGPYATLFLRAFSIDLNPGRVLPEERVPLEVERIHGGSEPLKRVLLWRRGALFAALVFLLPATLVHFIRDIIALADGANAVTGLYLLVSFGNIGLCIGAFNAFRSWDHWGKSRRMLFWTWAIAFVIPFLIALFPLRTLARQQGIFGGQEVMFGVMGAMNAIIGLAPKALSLVPGLLRAALTTKALFPGASAPGWLILLGTPYYLLLLMVVMLMPYQIAGGGLMALALFCFLAAPLFLIRAGRRLSSPNQLEPALETIRTTRMATAALNGAGGLFLFIGLIDLVSTLKLNPLDAVVPLISIVANVFVLGVIGVDTTLVAMSRGHVSHETAEQQAAREHFTVEMDAFIAAQDEAQPDVVSREDRFVDYDQPTERGSGKKKV